MGESEQMSRIVEGVIGPIHAKDLRIGGRSGASGAGRQVTVPIEIEGIHQVQLLSASPVVVSAESLAYALELAERKTSAEAEAAIGRQLVELERRGLDPEIAGAAASELFELANGARTGKPSPRAVAAANRILAPESMRVLPHTLDAADLIVLAYVVLHHDAVATGGAQ